uniref:Uncharacterized protein n=1 Tax=Arundo donax TaxID=35708 RepID=A0A0A9D5E8_ARUDO
MRCQPPTDRNFRPETSSSGEAHVLPAQSRGTGPRRGRLAERCGEGGAGRSDRRLRAVGTAGVQGLWGLDGPRRAAAVDGLRTAPEWCFPVIGGGEDQSTGQGGSDRSCCNGDV